MRGVSLATLVGLGVVGALRLRVETRILDDLPPGHPLLETRATAEKRFGGNLPMTLVVHPPSGGVGKAETKLLRAVLRFQDELAKTDDTGVLSSSLSAADFIGMAWRASGGEGSMPGRRADVERMQETVGEATLGRLFERGRPVATDRRARVRPRNGGDTSIPRARARLLPADRRGSGRGFEVQGFAYLAQRVHGSVAWNSMTSFLLDFAIVSVLVLVASRSWRLCRLAIAPNLAPLVVTVAFMGLAGIDLRISTSIVFAIVYGIAIDDTVHFLARFQEERRAGLTDREAAIQTMATTGRAMVFLGLVLAAGFSILTFSQFQPNRVLGLLMGVTVIAGLAGDLVLLPALLVPLPRRRPPWTFWRRRGALPVKARSGGTREAGRAGPRSRGTPGPGRRCRRLLSSAPAGRPAGAARPFSTTGATRTSGPRRNSSTTSS